MPSLIRRGHVAATRGQQLLLSLQEVVPLLEHGLPGRLG